MDPKFVAVIPASAPGQHLVVLVSQLQELGFRVLVVDDGGAPETQALFAACEEVGLVLRHDGPRGKGAALKTAFAWLAENEQPPYAVVTLNADGSYKAEDALRLCRAVTAMPEPFFLGSRRLDGNLLSRSKLGNGLSRRAFRAATGVGVYDTRTGLRAFSSALLEDLLTLEGEGPEYEMNVLLAMAGQRPVIELPIEALSAPARKRASLRESLRVGRSLFRCRLSRLSWAGKARAGEHGLA